MVGRKGDDEIRDKMAELVMVCDKESEIRQQRLQNATLSLRKSLRSSKSNADRTISINENVGKLKAESGVALSDMARAFFAGHNYQIDLSEGQAGAEYYEQMFAFLRQSRIAHVLSHSPVISERYLVDFWANARYVHRAKGDVIQSRIANNDLEFSAEDLRVILNLGTAIQEGGAEGLTVFDRSVIAGGLRRIGFAGDMTRSTLFKKGFYGRWRYLAHVLLVGLSNKKTGWDTLNQETQAQLVAIVYNKPYSFSKFFLNEIRKQITARGTARFLMYPRIIMMILNARMPSLPVIEPVVRVSTLNRRSYSEFRARNANDPNAQDVELFGAAVDINFPAPSDEDIADFERIPVLPQQPQQPPQPQSQPQPQPQQPPPIQPDAIAQQINVMLDEQAADPQFSQAVVHEVLQENAPINDPLVDVEAFHDGVPEDEAPMDAPVDMDTGDVGILADVAIQDDDALQDDQEDQNDRGKGIVEGSNKGGDFSDVSDSSDDDDNESRPKEKIVRIGSRMVSVVTPKRRRRKSDVDYVPDEGTTLETPPVKRARTTVDEAERTIEPVISVIPEVISVRPLESRPKTAQASTSQSTELENRVMIMEAQVKSMVEQMTQQQLTHAREMEVLSKRTEMLSGELMKMRQLVAQPAVRFDESRAQADSLERDHSYRQASLQHRVGVLDHKYNRMEKDAQKVAEQIFSSLGAQHQGLIRIEEFVQHLDHAVGVLNERLGIQTTCRDDPLRKERRDDGNDDPDATKRSEMSGLAHQSSTQIGTSTGNVGATDKGKDIQQEVDSEANPGMATQPREFFSKHNMLVSLDPTARGAEPYRQILEFLLRSRIFHVLTHSPTLMIDYVREFWRTARYDCVPNPPVIRARVNATDIAFSAVDIQAALQLGTDEQVNGPTEFSFELRVGAFQRMGYLGDVTKAQFTKSFLFGQWRYLMHVMIVSLSGRKAGFDVMGPKLQSAMISLVYNKPYSFSQYFFDEFVQQINAGGRERFLLYPRFVMMLLRRLLPNLPNLPQIVQVKSVDKRTFTDCMGHNSRHPADQRPQPTALFGFLVDPAYVAPPNDGWLDVQQPNQPEGDVLAPDAAAEVQQPGQEMPQDAALENQEVLIQVKQRPQQGADPIIPAVAEEVVQHILQEGNAHDEPRVDDPEDDILEQVEAYRGDDDLLAQVDAYKGDDADDASAPRDGGKDIDMGGAGGNESKRDSVTIRKGSKVKSATVSDPHPESSSRIKRKAADLNYVRTKRVRRLGGVVISEPIAIETTTPTATTTATPEFTASMATEMPSSSSIPSSSEPVFQVPDVLQCSELEGKFLILTARVNSLSSQWATQNVQHSEQVASLNKQVESSHQRVNSLEEEVEMLRRETVTQRRLNISQKERIGVLEAQCKNQSDFFQRLASQQQLQAGLLESVLQILGAQREKSSCKGSLPKITANPQETTIISMSAPFSSVSTDSGSSAKDDHSRQANRVGRKLTNVQGIQSSVLSPGSASSLRRSPRFKVKK